MTFVIGNYFCESKIVGTIGIWLACNIFTYCVSTWYACALDEGYYGKHMCTLLNMKL